MKLRFLLLFLLVTNLTSCYCEKKIALLGSHYVSDSSYKFYLITDDVNSPSTVNVELKSNENVVDSMTFNDFSTKPIEHEFTVEESNNFKLTVTSNECSQTTNLTWTSAQPMIFIHFNKPIYKTGEIMNFRVFVLDQKMIPMPDHKRMDITVYDSKGNAIKKIEDAKGDEFGTFQESCPIADDPYLGNWRIEVVIGDRTATKMFEVQKYNSGDIEVLVDAPSAVAYDDRRLYMTIYARNEDGDFVNGYATISLNASFVGSDKIEINKKNFKKVDLTGIKKAVALDIVEDIGVRFAAADMTLKFNIEVTEKSSKSTKSVQKEIKLMHKGRNTFQIIRKKYFKPGFKYPIKIRVKTSSGAPDNSFNQLNMELKYVTSGSSNVNKYSINLKNGETVQYFEPTEDTTQIIVDLEFGGSRHTEIIEMFPTFGVKEYMQVSILNKFSKIGDRIRISVKGTEEMEELHLIVFGLQGVVHSDKFPDSEGKDIFELSFDTTEAMKPEARGIVFYVKNGAIIYDEFSISLGFSVDNSINITVNQHPAKPNEEITLNVDTEAGAQVFLTAIDSMSSLLKRDFELSRTYIYNELSYYLNKKFPGSQSRYHFEKINPFILEPLIYGKNCASSRRNIDYDDEDEGTDNDIQGYFPKVSYESTSSYNNVMKVPNSLTTWKFYGISVHKTKGLTVLKTNPEVAVKNDVWCQIEVPTLLHPNEIVKARVTAFNFQDSEKSGKIVVSIENGVFKHEFHDKNMDKNCLNFTIISKNSLTFEEKLPADGKPLTVEFLISTLEPNHNGPIKLRAKVTTDESSHESEKNIDVTESNLFRKIMHGSYLIESKNGRKGFEETIQNDIGDKSSIIVHGNLLGPAVHGLENVFNKAMVLPEEKMLKFATSITIYEFTDLDGFENDKIKTKANNDMIKGYQEALLILQDIIKNNEPSKIWFASYITGILIDASEYITIDPKIINDSLDYIKKHVNSRNHLNFNRLDDLRRDIDGGANQKTVHSALIACTLIKKKDKFGSEISKLISDIKRNKGTGAYVRSIVAYTLALNGDTEGAKDVIKDLKPDFEKDKPKDKSMHVEYLSYMTLTKLIINEDPKAYVELMIKKHRHANGGFYSPYDTTLGLRALYEYTKYKSISTVNSQCTIGRNTSYLNQFDSVKFGVNKGDKIKFNGDALAYATVYSNVRKKDSTKLYNINVEIKEDSEELKMTVDFKYIPKPDNPFETNQVVLEVEIPRGYIYMNRVETDAIINNFELQKSGTFAVFYINNLEKLKDYKLTIRTLKVYQFYETGSVIARIYDYYRPNLRKDAYIIQDKNAVACKPNNKN
ncbi:CD109 antigen-like [Chironomus tepperi]|uniref:CD109 antigen-like n=1 Tax=Chironomus tepperi TaxID=113505 RepID=UPI00391F3918